MQAKVFRSLPAIRRSRPRSLTGQLALGGIAWIGLWALALLVIFNVLLSNVLSGQVDAALRARSEAVAATILVQDGNLEIAEGADKALDAGTSIYQDQTLVEGIDLGADLTGQLVQRGERVADREVLGPVRYLAEPVKSKGRQVGTIVVSSDVGARSRTGWIVGAASVAFIALMLGFTFFALRATIGRAMRPVSVMGDQAAAWSDKDIDRRFDPDAGPLELRRLALTLNSLLERISAALRHERRFTAELSHELRTPLAHLHAEVDLLAGTDADAQPEPVDAQDLARLKTSIQRLEGLVETALAPARIQPGATPGVGRMADVLADLLHPPAAAVTLQVSCPDDVLLSVESDVARRALLPVLENAWRYARSEVRIVVGVDDGMATIVIEDDGAALDPKETEMIFEPGFRADPGDGHPGAGLGLALTRRICRSAGGDVTATVRGDRTSISLTLPCIQL